MSSLPKTLHTAGKVTVLTSFVGVAVFAAIFLLNLGAEELQKVQAQSGLATTSITVLNTPPQWTVDAQEQVGSSTTTPTNSGTPVRWVATATDSNGAPYFLLICSTNAAPTANPAASQLVLGTAPPNCASTSTRWAVSPAAASGAQATAATTTLEAWSESNDWYAWICDDDPVNPRCNTTYKQGTGTTSSPFYVNHRPTFTAFADNSPALPGATVTFTSTSDDADVTGTADTVRLFVCSTASFSTTTLSCGATTLASSTYVATNAAATYTISIPTRDTNYGAFGYVVDNHSHLASGGSQGTDSVLTVNNATPFVNSGDITLNNGADMSLSVLAGQTTGFDVSFSVSDNNSCRTSTNGDEIVDYVVSVYRTNNSTSSCDAISDYDANDCYTSALATTTWNLSCTASTTSCGGPTDLTMVYDCTFPLWYVADPTDASTTPFFGTQWAAAAAGVDDDAATGVLVAGSILQDVASLLGIALDDPTIPYGALEPGDRTDPLAASTTIRAVGNTGIDELLQGESMCGTYTSAVTCPTSATSTIAERYQVFATSTVTYGTATSAGRTLSSTTQKELELNVAKPTATSTQTSGVTYWGIEVPLSITLAGSYTGENTFYGRVAEVADW